MTAVYGFDVLEVEPNWRDGLRSSYLRRIYRQDSGLGLVKVDDKSGRSFSEYFFPWFMANRSDIDVFRAFRLARKGRAVPVWVPTWRTDMVLASPALSTDTGFTIKAQGYTKFQFSLNQRRYLAIILPDGTKAYRKVVSSVDNGATEQLGLDAAIGFALPTAATISFLLLCRLSSDAIRMTWQNQNAGEAEFGLTEIPKEVP